MTPHALALAFALAFWGMQPRSGEPPSPPVSTPSTSTPAARDAEAIARLAEKVPDLRERLAALTPDAAEAYFRLGEEIAYEASGLDEFAVARRLFVLALHLNREHGGPDSLSASACVALADIERDERDRQWLRAVAGTLDPRHAAPDWGNAAAPPDEQAAYDAAVALGYLRSGQGAIARRYLDRPGVRELLERHATTITGTTASRAPEWLRELSRRYNDAERTVRERTAAGPDRFHLNPDNNGNPGPPLTDAQLVEWLRVEAALLQGTQQSWAAQVSGDGGAPLRNPDPGEIAAFYHVDVTRPCWRDGRWEACGGPAARAAGPEGGNPAAR